MSKSTCLPLTTKAKKTMNALVPAVLLPLISSIAHATEPPPLPTSKQIVAETALDLAEARPSSAIRKLEALADRNVVHPELSFNRALAYSARLKTPSPVPGDAGQAAAAFAEVLQLRPNDIEAQRGLREIQLHVASKSADKNSSSENTHLGLGARIIQVLSPNWLLVVGVLASLAAIAGIFIRRSPIENRRVAGSVALGVGAVMLIVSATLAGAHSFLFSGARVAVIISQRAPILDEAGAAIKGHLPLRESTVVHIGPTARGLAPLVGIGAKVWLRASQVRVLANK